MRLILIIIFLFIPLMQSCSQDAKEKKMQKKSIETVFKEHQDALLAVPGVQGFYQGALDNGADCIVIMVDKYSEEIHKALPDTLEGYPVIIEETGVIRPLDSDSSSYSPEE